VTTIDPSLAGETLPEFFIAAVGPLPDETVVITSAITVTLSCIDVTSVTTAYIANNGQNFVEDYTTDGHLFKIFVGTASTTETVDLSLVVTYTTDRDPDCLVTGVEVVPDPAALPQNKARKLQTLEFTASGFILTIDSATPFYGPIFLKALTYVPEVF
jgi:hypothetical protein